MVSDRAVLINGAIASSRTSISSSSWSTRDKTFEESILAEYGGVGCILRLGAQPFAIKD